MSTVNTITVTSTSGISVVTAGTQGVAGPNTILGRSVADATASTAGSLLVYDHTNTQWVDSQSTAAQSLNAKLYNLGFTTGGAVVTGILDEDNMGSNSNTKLATQQSIKSYVDVQNAAQAVQFQGDTGGNQSITINTEVLDIAGGTGIDTVGSSNTLTVAIDSTVVTLTGTQTLTNKTLTAPVLNTVDINAGDISSDTTINKSPVITLAGDLSGSATLSQLGNATLTATIVANSVALGTDTTGNYVATITAGEGIDVSGSGSETASVTISAEDATSSNKGIASFDSTDFTVSSGAVTVNVERIQDVVGAMLSSNTESGIAVTYQDSDGTIDFNADDFTITLAGDLSGNVTITDLADATLTATIVNNAVELGTDTTGNYVATVTAANTGIDVANSGSETAGVTVGLNTEHVQDLVGAMFSSNTESGISVTYEDSDGTIDLNVADPVITLSGDVAGSATMTNLGDVTISTTIQANSVALGTDTTGNYVATVAAGEGIDVSGSGSETAAITISAEDATDSNKGIASFDATDFSVSSGDVTLNAERVQDIVGAMISSNTESGISVTYEDSDGTLDFDVSDPTLTFTGDVTGSGTITNLGNTSIALTVAANSVALGTDTTGNYVATIADAGNSHITVANSGAESAAVTLNITDSAVDTAQIADNAVTLGTKTSGNYVATISGTSNEIEVSGSGSETASVTIGLPDDVTIGGDLTITGDLTVNGTTTTINTANLDVEDATIRFAKNATTLSATNGAGLEFGGSSSKPTILWDNSNTRLVANKVFKASSFVGDVAGNATTATTLATARSIALSGDVTATGVDFDGSGAITLSTTIAANSVALGTDTTGNYLATLAAANAGIDVANSGAESAAVTVGLNSEYVQDLVGAMFSSNTETGITVTYQDDDGTIDVVIGSNDITNAMLANSTITVSDGSNSTATALGGTITFAAGEGLDVAESSGTVTFSAEDATSSNKGVASFTNHFSVSSGAVSLASSGVSAASYGSSTAIPVITIDAQGRITNASTASINTNFTLAADSGSNDTFSTGGTLTFTGGAGIDTTVSDDTITIAAELATETNAGVATFDGTDFTVSSGDVTINAERVQDIVGAMFSSNTETNITATYQDSDGTIDLVVSTLNQDTTGNAATATALETARTIGGTSFDGTSDIAIALSTLATNITATANNSTDESVFITFVDGATGTQGIETDTGLTYNPSSGNLTISGELSAASLDISGNVDIDGTLEADAITVNGTTLAETISDTVGAMVGSNTETGISVTYDDSDNTLDFVVGTLNQDTTGTAALATSITVSANNSTDETVFPVFVDGATGTQGAETDTGLTYNPSTGLLTATGFSGNLTGTLQTAAQTNITSVGTLSALAVTGDLTVNTNVLAVDTSNNRVGIKTASPSVSLDAGSATDAFFVPKGTTAQRPTGAAGHFRYNTTLGRFEGYTDAWGEIGGGGGTNTFTVDNFTTANSSTTAFTLSQTPDSEDNLIVFIGGVFQNPNDYTLNGTTLTLDEAPPSGTRIIVYSVKAAVSGSNLNNDQFTASGSAAFTLSIAPVSENNTQVFIDGVYQQKTDYSVSGTTLTFDTAPTSGAIVEVNTFTQTEINVPVDNTITTAKLVDANVTTAKIAADAITAAKIADDAISEEHLDPTVISGLTEVTAAGADHFMIFDATDSALKKSLVSDVIEQAAGISSSADATAITIDSSENTTLAGTLTTNGVINTGTSHNFAINTPNSVRINIDSNDSATDQVFVIGKNQTAVDASNDVLFKIGEDGKAGIGLGAPNATLHVGSSNATGDATNPAIQIGGSSTFRLGMYTSAEGGVIENKNGDDGLQFRVKTAGEAMRIDASGNVLIGATSTNTGAFGSSSPQLLVAGTMPQIALHETDDDKDGYIGISGSTMFIQTADDIPIRFGQNDAEVMRIDTDGRLAINNTTSAADSDIHDQVKLVCGGGVVVGSAAQSDNSFLQYTDAGGLTVLQGSGTYGLRIFDDNSSTPRFTVLRSGNVGISNNAPDNKLQVDVGSSSAGTDSISVQNSGVSSANHTAGLRFQFSSAVPSAIRSLLTNTSNGEGTLSFFTSSDGTEGNLSEHMRIDSAGKVGINTTTMNGELNIHAGATNAQTLNMTGLGGNVIKFAPYISNGAFSSLSHVNDVAILAESAGGIVIAHATSGNNGIRIVDNGDLEVGGALSKGSGSFRIDHPLESKKDTHYLVHSFIEGPQADNIYRGKVDLVKGSATVNIDTAAGMTEGTFVALNTNVQCFTSNETDWDSVKGTVSGNTLTISCQNASSTATVSWLVIGERQDQHMKDTRWTNDEGKVIVEPLKPTDDEE